MSPPISSPPSKPIDLRWTIKSEPVTGGLTFDHTLEFPSGKIRRVPVEGRSRRVHENDLGLIEGRLYSALQAALRRQDESQEPLTGEQTSEASYAVGDGVSRLLPLTVRDFLRAHLSSIGSILIVTDDPRLPWELCWVGPEGREDFLCCRVDVGRWLTSAPAPPLHLEVEEALGLIAGEVSAFSKLTSSGSERGVLEEIAEDGQIRLEIFDPAFTSDFLSRIQSSPPDLMHFSGHGEFDEQDPELARLVFADRSLSVYSLTHSILREMSKRSSLVFLNACRSGRSGQALVGSGGWPNLWVRVGHCGALICPAWAVRDSTAAKFATIFYRKLGQQTCPTTLGRAIRETRLELLEEDPSDPTPLAYFLYGHPDARTSLGRPKVSLSQQREISEPVACTKTREETKLGVGDQQGQKRKRQEPLIFWHQLGREVIARILRQPGRIFVGLGVFVSAGLLLLIFLGARAHQARELLLGLREELSYSPSVLLSTGFSVLSTLPWKGLLALTHDHSVVAAGARTLFLLCCMWLLIARLKPRLSFVVAVSGLTTVTTAFGGALYTLAIRASSLVEVGVGPRRWVQPGEPLGDQVVFQVTASLRNDSLANDIFREALNGLSLWLIVSVFLGIWACCRVERNKQGLLSRMRWLLVALNVLILLFLALRLPEAHAVGEWGLKYPLVVAISGECDRDLATKLESGDCLIFDVSAGATGRRFLAGDACGPNAEARVAGCAPVLGRKSTVTFP